MLFAAGFGTRMGALTADRPKPLVEVAGRPLIDHALALRDDFGPLRTVANLHYRGDQLRRHLQGRDVLFSEETPEILETGGGLRKALPLLASNPVFTMNTDAAWTGTNPLIQLAEAWDPARMDALLLLIAPERARGHAGGGDFLMAPDGSLKRGPGAIYSGVQILKTDLLDSIPEPAFSLNLLWDAMLRQGRLHGVMHAGGWCDVGRPESIPLAEAMLAEAADV
ncbi:nucleotidyltransferase family protein [Pseudoruegeria aquimaris]|nr:nucleotidyltransferase family protein [Pseudoruegeria aquimaris]